MKRIFDVVLASIGLIMLFPLMVLIGVCVRWESPGPAIYRQQRIGKNRQPFSIYKFRTMVTGAQQVGPMTTSPNDQRVTRVGFFLRRSSLDELPQLINVIQGSMSLVGPRPDQLFQQHNYSPEQWEMRHLVRPGITGLAQIFVRNGSDHQTRTDYDLRYVREHCFGLDLKIMVMTVWQVIVKGSY